MKHKPNILVVGSFVLDQIATTSVFPAEGETVLGDDFIKLLAERAQIRRCRPACWARM